LLKYNLEGEIIAVTQNQIYWVDAKSVDKQGNIFLTGHFDPRNPIYFDKDNVMNSKNLGQDIFLVKYDKNCKYKWSIQAGSKDIFGVDYSFGVDNDEQGNVYITGLYEHNLHLGDTILNSTMEESMFLAKFDTNGKFLWAFDNQNAGADCGTSIVIKGDNLFYAGTVQSANLSYSGNLVKQGSILSKMKLKTIPTGIKEININKTFLNIYPNPTTGVVKIENQGSEKHVQIFIRNSLGDTLLQKSIDDSSISLDLSSFPMGFYFVDVLQNDKKVTKKIVLQ
jgi:hypothetical protein